MQEGESRVEIWDAETETWKWEVNADGIPSLIPDPETIAPEELYKVALQVSKATGKPLPITGKMILYDGKTGETDTGLGIDKEIRRIKSMPVLLALTRW